MRDPFADRDKNPPPAHMTPEHAAALRAIGMRFGTGEPLRDFKPLKLRPRWQAFLLTLIGYRG
jgi:hypothetical protein